MVSIHDPIHGTIDVTPAEIKLIDSRPLQRLRTIKQLGFSELAFPGATHSRYAHSLGAMQMATRMIERVLADLGLAPADGERIRQTARLALLFHDLGHPPMSHVSERVMPPVGHLRLGAWLGDDDPARQATHEDYTVKLLIDSELTGLIEQHFGHLGISGARLAGLIVGRHPPGDPDAYAVQRNGARVDLLPLLTQIASSEMDADRMDYLRRDAYYCGVSYGNFDHVWLTNSLTAVEHDGQLVLALRHKGVWAFENFLLSRYHMFLSVYHHHTALCFDHLLRRWYDEGGYTLPSSSEAYLDTDDAQLLMALRASDSPWAERIVRRRPYRLLLESHGPGPGEELEARLRERQIDFFIVRKKAVLSKYVARGRRPVLPLLVIEPEVERTSRIEDYTPLYRRFDEELGVSRIFCEPTRLEDARRLLKP